VKKCRGVVSQNNVVHIKKKNQDVGISMEDKHRGINIATHKTIRQKKAPKVVEPSLRGLLQTM